MPKRQGNSSDSGDISQEFKYFTKSIDDKLDRALQEFQNITTLMQKKIDELETRNLELTRSLSRENHIQSELSQGRLQRQSQVSNFSQSNSRSSLINLKLKEILPKFNGKDDNPIQFLKALKRLIPSDITPSELLILIRTSLVNDASTWFSIVENTFKTFPEFESLFLNKYWGEIAQSRVRTDLFTGKFDSSKSTSRERYFTKKFSIMQHLSPNIEEPELIKHLSRHFNFEIVKSVITQKVRFYSEFCDILQQFDDLDKYEQDIRVFKINSSHNMSPNSSSQVQFNHNNNNDSSMSNRPFPPRNNNRYQHNVPNGYQNSPNTQNWNTNNGNNYSRAYQNNRNGSINNRSNNFTGANPQNMNRTNSNSTQNQQNSSSSQYHLNAAVVINEEENDSQENQYFV